jgi:hypothetical protein
VTFAGAIYRVEKHTNPAATPDHRSRCRTIDAQCPSTSAAQQSQAKLSKADSAYQDSPKNDQQCSECTKFQPPKGCSVVTCDINPKGWCKLYEAPPE